MYLQLYQIKKHLNIDELFYEDDEYLLELGIVAEMAVEKHIDDSLDNIANGNGGVLPSPLLQAMLLLIGNLYANRESVAFTSSTEVPHTFTYLIDLYRNYGKFYTGGKPKNPMPLPPEVEHEDNDEGCKCDPLPDDEGEDEDGPVLD